MTNVGLYVCAKCYFNEVVQQFGPAGGPGPWAAKANENVGTKSFCEIRGIRMHDPFETTCLNFKPTPFQKREPQLMEPRGPLQTYGLRVVGNYFRLIPWHRDEKPLVGNPTGCQRCQTKVDKGISIRIEGFDSPLEFCCNKHYMYWWCSLHGTDIFDPDDF